MCNAAFTGQLHVLQRLRTADVDVNASDPAFGGTALMVAAGKGHRECVELLLACGAQKDAAARDGKTAFIVAALNGFVGCTKILARCVRIPARLFGNSPRRRQPTRHKQATNRRMNFRRCEQGANWQVLDGQKKSALDHALENGHEEVVAFLARNEEQSIRTAGKRCCCCCCFC